MKNCDYDFIDCVKIANTISHELYKINALKILLDCFYISNFTISRLKYPKIEETKYKNMKIEIKKFVNSFMLNVYKMVAFKIAISFVSYKMSMNKCTQIINDINKEIFNNQYNITMVIPPNNTPIINFELK